MAKLGEICTIYSGTGFPVQYQGNSMGKYPFYKVGDIARNVTQGYIFLRLCENFIDEDVCEMIKGTIIPENTIVFAKIGEAVKLNRRAITTKDSLIDNNAMGIKPNEAFIALRYFYHFMCRLKLEEYAEATTVPSVKKTTIEKIDIPLPTLETQRKIAANLDKVTHTIDLCNAILEKLDLLVKSRFVEMFGEPVSNSKCWSTVPLGELTTKIGSGATPKGGRESYGTEGISLIRSMNVHNGYFEYKELAHISDEQAEKLDNVTIHKSDVLLNITGASVARCCIVPSDVLPARVNQHVCIIRCKKEVLPVFVCGVLTDDNYQKHLWDIAGSGATREAITKQQIENLSMIVPPFDLQEQFAAFVEQTDKSKLAVKQVLEKAEMLKKALMQKYFG